MRVSASDIANNDKLRLARHEIVLVSIVVLLGVAMRVAYPSRMSIEHFDEGVYASSIWFGATEDYQYPKRHLYAPPLLPGLVEWSILLFGYKTGTMIPSLMAGCATLLVIWWMARQWFGPVQALASTTLASFSDFHQLMARTALTDVLLVFWWLLALLFLVQAFRSHQPRMVVVAGVATGLAWWTKYNGWLPLALGLGGLTLWTFFQCNRRRFVLTTWLCWLAVCVIALIVWCPVLISLYQTWGGYHVVAENHRTYLVGWTGWWGSFIRQAGNLRHFDGWSSCLGPGLALLGATLFRWFRNDRHEDTGRSPLAAIVLAFSVAMALVSIAALIGSSWLMGLLTVVALAVLLWHNRRSDESSIVVFLLAVWFFVLLGATPFYRAYARLTLPWLACTWLGAGVVIGRLAEWLSKQKRLMNSTTVAGGTVGVSLGCWFISVALLVWLAPDLSHKGFPSWAVRTGFEPIASKIRSEAQKMATNDPSGRSGEAEVYVYGEPGLFFHLKVAGVRLMAIEQLDFQRQTTVPTLLVTGPHAHRSRAFQDDWSDRSAWFSRIDTYSYPASDLVLLDHYRPGDLKEPNRRPQEEVRLYRLK